MVKNIYEKTKKSYKHKVKKSKLHQNGKSIFKKDKKRKALHPGKRISRNGNIYYEYRANESDLDRRRKI